MNIAVPMKRYPTTRRHALWLLVLLVICLPGLAEARASLQLYPTRLVVDSSQGNASLDITNPGDMLGSYRIEFIEMEMPEVGVLRPLQDGDSYAFSIQPFTRLAPRRMTLAPRQSRKIRMRFKVPDTLAPGEYRSHLKVTLLSDHPAAAHDSPAVDIQVNQRYSLIIPVILRHRAEQARVFILDAALLPASDQARASLSLLLAREGASSTIGDILIHHIDLAGRDTLLAKQAGIAIYRPTPRRRVQIMLDDDADKALRHPGELRVRYTQQSADGGRLLADRRLPLPVPVNPVSYLSP